MPKKKKYIYDKENTKKIIIGAILLFILYVIFFIGQPMAILALVFVFFIALGLSRPNFRGKKQVVRE